MSEMTSICKCCHASYEEGSMNFYNLCNPCFNQFDNRKMERRFQILRGERKHEDSIETESSDTFVKSGLCTHSEAHNIIKSFISALDSAIETK